MLRTRLVTKNLQAATIGDSLFANDLQQNLFIFLENEINSALLDLKSPFSAKGDNV